MDLTTLADWWLPAALRRSALAYAAANAAHLLGIGLLVGAALPMDLRLLGAFRRVPVSVVVPFLWRVAAVGLALAMLTGALLFTVNPTDYAANPALRIKLLLLLAALALIAVQHANPAFRRAVAGEGLALSVRVTAVVSGMLWLCILFAGRWIGFV